MKRSLTILCAALALVATVPALAADAFAEIRWEELVPKGWDPSADLRGMDLGKLQDSDPRAMEALEKLRAAWDAAPLETSLAGRRVRLPGFAIPLEAKGEKISEFLLVPYFGACIHTPPPPANQIVHVVSPKPLPRMRSMDAVWVSGTLSLQGAATPWGRAGYRLTVEKVAPYEEPRRK